jgi:hypothetical protein
MTTTRRADTFLAVTAATLAAAVFSSVIASVALASVGPVRQVADATPAVVHTLPRVVVTGHVQPAVAQVVDLPRVVVTGRIAQPSTTETAQAAATDARS